MIRSFLTQDIDIDNLFKDSFIAHGYSLASGYTQILLSSTYSAKLFKFHYILVSLGFIMYYVNRMQ